jgi:hypothetical protein
MDRGHWTAKKQAIESHTCYPLWGFSHAVPISKGDQKKYANLIRLMNDENDYK